MIDERYRASRRESSFSRALLVAAAVAGLACGGSSKPQVKQCLLNSDCASPLVCGQGYCVGQCVTGRDCNVGQDCIILPSGKVCQAPEKKKCVYNSDCDPLFCGVDQQCRNQCQTAVDCVTGDVCAINTAGTMLCVDPVTDKNSYDAATNTIKPAPDGGVSAGGNGGGLGGAAGSNVAGGHAGSGVAGTPGAAGSGVGGAGGRGGMGGAHGGGGGQGQTGAAGNAGLGGTSGAGGQAPWHLWVVERNLKHLYGYAPKQLITKNGDAPEIDLTLPSSSSTYADLGGPCFDPQGNLWLSANYITTVVDNTAYFWEFDAAQLTTTATIAPKRVITLPSTSFINSAQWLACGADGSLWSNTAPTVNNGTLSHYDAATLAQLTATPSTPSPELLVTGRTGSGGIIADAAGDLFVSLRTVKVGSGMLTPVGRYDALQLVGTGTINDAPDLTILPVAPFGAATYPTFFLAPSGSLYVASGDLYRYSPTQIGESGSVASSAPEAHFTITGLATGSSFFHVSGDPDGNLYLCDGGIRVIKLAAADLMQSGTATLAPAMTLQAPTQNPNAIFNSSAVH